MADQADREREGRVYHVVYQWYINMAIAQAVYQTEVKLKNVEKLSMKSRVWYKLRLSVTDSAVVVLGLVGNIWQFG